MAKSLLRIKAGELRRRGTSIKEISKILSVSTSTASRWCGDIFLTKEQSYKLELLRIEGQKRGRILASEVLRQRRLNRIKQYEAEGLSRFKRISEKEFYSAGLALYSAEGAKKSRRVMFTNSDPKIIRFMIGWFKEFYNININKMTCSVLINISHKHREKEIKKFWSKQLNMPISQFRKTKIVKSKNKKIYDNPQDYHGTFTFSVIKSADLCYKILGQIYGMMTAI
ncbi:MAG: hypothetical protein A3G45_00315 [Candidatus Staskawiczbacteria bacterium RIFCSPLOWO2_12_FULL_37_15]|uniref:Resolvase HTH domain-containing protein n=1 Tax=Candidatus Staskawiczbacteria bacterium RIFCSPLOWO2_12_FULL_37_15 TaxID=1802218 RepID=A0A1G2IPF6_9BACT|nr:MAG: hypothetical protein A3G45_00315 [Candidatus Staskawiczbacteria bacterium RIFCSPLOWO2_12_FULL_37_15]OHA25913.1 MAG: hypothetical protein A3D52_02960 [Candidatus Taylorbacteria bacterium RIFCSPHIGHO2_02_FULL_44_36]HXK41022.1 helix-turn-helix domain-containing protein [Candidatus Paceibacterota bacterium]